MQTLLLVVFVICCCVIFVSNAAVSQKCLSSPRDIAWEWNEATQSYAASMDYVIGTVKDPNGRFEFTSRLYDGDIKAPLLRMKRGTKYSLTLNNRLEHYPIDGVHSCNITNIHTHGLHVSGMPPGDSILTRIMPGTSYTYHYNVPIDHMGGIHWYHPHYHKSTAYQVGSGAAGVVIVEDNPKQEKHPRWLKEMPQIILQIFHAHMVKTTSYGGKLRCSMPYSGLSNFYLVNGELKPTICLKTDEWMRLRISFVDPEFVMTMIVDSRCDIKLLAKDGIYLNEIPRDLPGNEVYFTQAGRADVALKCPRGEFTIKRRVEGGHEQELLAHISVCDGDRSKRNQKLRKFEPIRPEYLRSTLHVRAQKKWRFSIQFNGINDVTFGGIDNFEYIDSNLTLGTIEEWELEKDEHQLVHPFHLHVFPFQLQHDCIHIEQNAHFYNKDDNADVSNKVHNPYPLGWYQKGDWHDTINCGVRFRFRVRKYDGDVYLHCHNLRHEDFGAMGMRRVVKPKIEESYEHPLLGLIDF